MSQTLNEYLQTYHPSVNANGRLHRIMTFLKQPQTQIYLFQYLFETHDPEASFDHDLIKALSTCIYRNGNVDIYFSQYEDKEVVDQLTDQIELFKVTLEQNGFSLKLFGTNINIHLKLGKKF